MELYCILDGAVMALYSPPALSNNNIFGISRWDPIIQLKSSRCKSNPLIVLAIYRYGT